jgi:acid phosphatase family membrane protein YuiD
MSFPVRASSIEALFENPLVLAPLTSWFFAQLMKATVALLRSRKRNVRDIVETLVWRTGGMPSSHAALVSCIAITAAFSEGLDSNIFALSIWFSMVVIRDAMGVRRAAGLQARVLNQLGRNVAEKLGIAFHPVKEIQGHGPLEVVVGVLLGTFIAVAYAWL